MATTSTTVSYRIPEKSDARDLGLITFVRIVADTRLLPTVAIDGALAHTTNHLPIRRTVSDNVALSRLVSSHLSKLSQTERDDALLQAVVDHEVTRMQQLLAAHANPEYLSSSSSQYNGMSALHIAAMQGHVDSASILIDHHTGLNLRVKATGATPLYLATSANQPDIVQLLSDRGANPNIALENGVSPLHLSCERGYTSISKTLLAHSDNSADDTPKGRKSNQTPLCCAAARGHVDIVRILIKSGQVDINSKSGPNHITPLIAALSARPQAPTESLNTIVESLLGAGPCEVGYKRPRHKPSELAHYRPMPRMDLAAASALALAVASGYSRITELLLRHQRWETAEALAALQCFASIWSCYEESMTPEWVKLVDNWGFYIAVRKGYVRVIQHLFAYLPIEVFLHKPKNARYNCVAGGMYDAIEYNVLSVMLELIQVSKKHACVPRDLLASLHKKAEDEGREEMAAMLLELITTGIEATTLPVVQGAIAPRINWTRWYSFGKARVE